MHTHTHILTHIMHAYMHTHILTHIMHAYMHKNKKCNNGLDCQNGTETRLYPSS